MIQLIDYVKDSKIENGSVFNGMTVRFVGKDVLFDYAGMNPEEAKHLDPKNIMGIKENEVLRNTDVDDEPKDTINHELNEYREMKTDPSEEYWVIHTTLQKLSGKPEYNLSINTEATVMKTDTTNRKYQIVPMTIRKNADGQDEILITTPNYDRRNDRVIPSGAKLDNYLKNPVIMWIHDYKGATPAAGLPMARNSYLKVTDEGIIAGPPIFLEGDPFADRVKNAWNQKLLNTASIGFQPIKSEPNDQGGTDFTEWEMLEWSFAPIPMNAEAARIAKSSGLEDLVEKEIITKPEVTEDYIRIPNPKAKGSHDGHKIRTIVLSEKEGIKALYCVDDKVNITYLFEKAKNWTTAKAEAWVKEHSKSVSQAEIKDEIDYIKEMVTESGLSDENKTELRRLTGSDIPDNHIELKMSQKTHQAIKDAVDACDKCASLIEGHHKAHGKAYESTRDIIKTCHDSLGGLLPSPTLPAEDSDEDKTMKAIKEAFDKLTQKILEV